MTEAPFRFAVRIYYEDTDAAGVVYYANYLKYLERARTEWLGALGFELAALEREHGIAFAVHRLEVVYVRPARLGDRVLVTVQLVESGRVRLVLDQFVERDGETLLEAHVALACVRARDLRPSRIPDSLARVLASRGQH